MALALQYLFKEGALLVGERPLLYKPFQQLGSRPPENSLNQVTQQATGNVLVRPDRRETERPLKVQLAKEPLIVQPAHQVRNRRIGPIQTRRGEAITGLRRRGLPVLPEDVHHLKFPIRQVFRGGPRHGSLSFEWEATADSVLQI